MSHQTGIKEQLSLDGYENVKENWEKDYDATIGPLIEDDQPCYILYRLDSKNGSNYEWLLISWTPDTAPVRQKMLYASTKATLKQEFGSSQIIEEIHGTVLNDITFNGYLKYKRSAAAPAPLSMREEELNELKKTEVNTEISVDTKQQTLGGVAFPITEAAQQAIKDMANGSYDYLQFRIDIEEETIHLVTAENIVLEKLPSKVPKDSGRYHLYKFKHTHEGDYTENFIFIYSMPGYSCPIKERMLYSSCKNPLTDTISNLGLEISKKVEVDSGDELTEKYFYDELHPTNSLHRPQFARPKGPPNRGPKRMTKSNQ